MLPSAASLIVSALASPGSEASPRWRSDFSCQDCVMEQRTGTGSFPEGEGWNEIVNQQLKARYAGWVEPGEMVQWSLPIFLLWVSS